MTTKIAVPKYGSKNADGSINRFDPNTGLSTAPSGSGSSSNINNYNPNTGALMTSGQTVQIGNTGNYVTQGTPWTPTQNIAMSDLTTPVNPIESFTPPLFDTNGVLNKGANLNDNVANSIAIQQEIDKNSNNTTQMMKDLMSSISTGEQNFNSAMSQSGKGEAQQIVNDENAKLQAIIKRGQANQLSVVGQGRGIPEAILGGQQAQFARETAIESLPVQASLEAAQGNLQAATETFGYLMTTKTQDAQNKLTYGLKLIDTVSQFATQKEQVALDAIKLQEQRNYDTLQKDKAKITALGNTLLTNRAPSSLVLAVGNTKTYAEALAIPGISNYMTDPQDRAIKNAQIKGIIEKNTATNDDLEAIADAIINGDQPPVLTGLYSKSAGVRADLARKGYNLVKAQTDWEAVKKFTAANNSTAQVRMKQAEASVENSLPNLQSLVSKLESDGAMTGFKFVNKASITAAANGLYGETARNDAQALIGQIALVSDELGQTFMGGNSPTDAAFDLVKGVLASNFTASQFKTQIDLIQTNLKIRKNSWSTVQATGIGGANQYTTQDPLGVGITNTNNDPLGLGI